MASLFSVEAAQAWRQHKDDLDHWVVVQHQDLATDCPGSPLEDWIHDGIYDYARTVYAICAAEILLVNPNRSRSTGQVFVYPAQLLAACSVRVHCIQDCTFSWEGIDYTLTHSQHNQNMWKLLISSRIKSKGVVGFSDIAHEMLGQVQTGQGILSQSLAMAQLRMAADARVATVCAQETLLQTAISATLLDHLAIATPLLPVLTDVPNRTCGHEAGNTKSAAAKRNRKGTKKNSECPVCHAITNVLRKNQQRTDIANESFALSDDLPCPSANSQKKTSFVETKTR